MCPLVSSGKHAMTCFRLIVCFGSFLWLGREALAGQTRFGWLRDTDTVPQRGVELESWVAEEDGERPQGMAPAQDETTLFWSPVVGLTDRLELALPLLASVTGQNATASTSINRFGAELRWRLTEPDPVESGPLASLLRLGIKRLIAQHDGLLLEGGVVASWNAKRVHLVVDLEGVAEIMGGAATYGFRPGAGLSARITGDLRLGAEAYAELGFHDPSAFNWAAAGPNLAWSYGRFWLSASCLVGLWRITVAPRLNWAVAF
jgi:hypothetical protein